MSIRRSLRAIRTAEADRIVDWEAAATAAREGTPRGELDLADDERERYADAVREARDAIARTLDRPVDLPEAVEAVDRHHWIDRTATNFGRIVDPALAEVRPNALAGTVNAATAATTLGLLGRRVVGQFDPALFRDPEEATLVLVHPNVVRVAAVLDVDRDRFRRWVLHHEVSHAAEFTIAPWLRGHLEDHIRRTLETLSRGRLDRSGVAELDRTMTAVEGFAELLMDEAMPGEVDELRTRLESRRAGVNPLIQLLDWLLGIAAKRRQYERGRAFFEAVARTRGLEATVAVWDGPDSLPTGDELDDPRRWMARVLG